ncbi:MAG: zinc ribbon domain-containing protein [Planctomycetota bacterium]|nr:zinc ribbon domain-containing protein [Planctomycetota bacterium]
MEDCPYCGAEVEATAVKCDRCGAILKEVDDDQMAEIAKANEKLGGPKHEPCPHCEAPAPIGAHRCKECGRVINALPDAPNTDSFKYGTWAVFGGVGFLVILIISIAVMLAGGEEKRVYVTVNGPSLAGKFSELRIKQNATKVNEDWEKTYKGKYVKVTGMVVSKDGNEVIFALSGKAKAAKKGEAKVEFLDSAEADISSLEPGATFSYDAKLMSYNEEGFLFIMTKGKAVE